MEICVLKLAQSVSELSQDARAGGGGGGVWGDAWGLPSDPGVALAQGGCWGRLGELCGTPRIPESYVEISLAQMTGTGVSYRE